MSIILKSQLVVGPLPKRVSSGQQRYLGLISIVLLAALVCFNASLSYKPDSPPQENLNAQLMLYGLFCLAWFGWVGRRLDNAVFAAVAFVPSVLVGGYGVFLAPFGGFTLSDLMITTACIFWLLGKPALRWTKYIRIAVALCGVCITSAVLTHDARFAGAVLRLILIMLFIWIVFSERGINLKRAFVDGVMLWPVTALAYLIGTNAFWEFISFSGVSSVTALYGSHEAVQYLFPLIPLAMVHRFKQFTPFLLTVILIYAVFSFSRSLMLVLVIVGILRLLSTNAWRRSTLSMFWFASIGGVLFWIVTQLGFFNFSESGLKGDSNIIRFAKMANAVNTYLSNPVLGVGFGAVGVIDTEQVESIDLQPKIIESTAAAESTPFQIIAETGTLGALLSLWLLVFSGLRLWRTLQCFQVPAHVKAVLCCWAVVFLTALVGSNAYSSLILMLAIPVAAFEVYVLDPRCSRFG